MQAVYFEHEVKSLQITGNKQSHVQLFKKKNLTKVCEEELEEKK